MLYEGYRSGLDNAFHMHLIDDFGFPLHMHRSYELVIVLEGKMSVTVNGIVYDVCPGEALIVFPYRSHSYRSTPPSKALLFIFSAGIVPFFHRRVEKLYPPHPVFSLKESGAMRMIDRINEIGYDMFEAELNDPFMKKGFLYSVLGSFMKQCRLEQREIDPDTTLLERILSLIDSLPPDRISLRTVAEQLKYEYSYISKYFRRTVGITFTMYVNQYRIHIACHLLQDEKCKIIDVAMRVGYNSLRSFNGNFKKMTGITPGQFIAGERPEWASVGPIVVPEGL